MYSNKKNTTKESLPPIPNEERAKFNKVLKVQTHTSNEFRMHYYITRWLNKRQLDWAYDDVGNIIVTKGEADWYPCIVAHLDTVHRIVNNFRIMHTKTGDGHDMLYAKSGKHKTGIGGDDKCGIYAVLYMLEHFETIKAVFFTQEEGGCIGSSDIDLSLLNDVGYVIQLDRWGRSDFICKDYNCDFVSDDFQDDLKELKEQYGYEDAEGLITDSVTLFKRKIGVSCINLSCGYYQHHSDAEKIDLNQFWNAIRFTEETITRLGCNLYEKEFVRKPSKYRYSYNDGYDGDEYYTPPGKVRGFKNGVPGYWEKGDFHPDNPEPTALPEHTDAVIPEEDTTPIEQMTEEEYYEYLEGGEGPYDWIRDRFWHAEYDGKGTIVMYMQIDPLNFLDVLRMFNFMGVEYEEAFSNLNSYWKNRLGEEYFAWYGGVLYDKIDQIGYGLPENEEGLPGDEEGSSAIYDY